jgi:hypothetical protein
VVPDAAIPLLDFSPVDVFPKADKHPQGALVRTLGEYNFVAFTKYSAIRSIVYHVRNLLHSVVSHLLRSPSLKTLRGARPIASFKHCTGLNHAVAGATGNVPASPRVASSSDYLAAIGVPISVPIISPEITISTRRFCCRPCAVSLEATGWDFPKPCVVTDDGAIPDCVR